MNCFVINKAVCIYIISAILLHYVAYAIRCPPAELIQPCKCEIVGGADYITVTCEYISNAENIRQVFKRVDGWKFDSLVIQMCTLLYIPSSIFNKSEFGELTIKGSTLTSIFDTAPVSVKSLKKFTIFSSTIHQGIRWNQLKNFDLDSFTVLDTVIGEIGEEFKNSIGQSSNLNYLHFKNNGIRRVTGQPFENLHNLKRLFLENQYFKSLQPLVFPEDLQSINLSGNNLKSLPDHFFGDRPKLIADVGNNHLTSVPQEVFGVLKEVFINGNPLDCTCAMKWITDIKFKIYHIEGTCVSPTRMRNKKVQNLKASDFDYCV